MTSSYPLGSLVVYAGQFWRVMGHQGDRVYLRSPGWENSAGWWGWNGYGFPVAVATIAPMGSGLFYHA